MGLRWLDPDGPDRHHADGAVTVLEAARTVDCPHEPGLTPSAFAARLGHGWDGDAPHTAVLRDRRGTVAGVLEVTLPGWDNTHLGEVAVTIDPPPAGGLGTRLFDAGLDRVRQAGRTLVYAHCLDQPGPVAFLTAMGLERAYEDVQRRQDLRAVDRGRLDAAYGEAEGFAAGDHLIRLPWPTPQDMVPDIVRMTGAINDAPTGSLAIEDEVFSPERVRPFEAAQQAQGWRLYRLVAAAFPGHPERRREHPHDRNQRSPRLPGPRRRDRLAAASVNGATTAAVRAKSIPRTARPPGNPATGRAADPSAWTAPLLCAPRDAARRRARAARTRPRGRHPATVPTA